MFQVGNLVTGTIDNPYGITTEKTLCIVTEVSESGDRIRVAPVAGPRHMGSDLNHEFPVDRNYFELCSPKEFYNTHMTDFVIENRFSIPWSSEATTVKFELDGEYIASISIAPDEVQEDSNDFNNVLCYENFEPVVWSDAEIERMSDEAGEALAEFENCEGLPYDWNSEVGKKIIRKCNEEKGWLERIFSAHPNYDSSLHGIVLTEKYTRKPNEEIQSSFWSWIAEKVWDNVPEEYLLDSEKVRNGVIAYKEADQIAGAMMRMPAPALVDYAGQDFYYWRERLTETKKYYSAYRARRHDSHGNYMFFTEEGMAWEEKADSFLSSTSRSFLSKERITEEGARYFNRLFDISAQAGQKTSTIIRKVAKIIGLDKIKDLNNISWTDSNTGEVHTRQKDLGWNYQFTRFCDAIKPCEVERYTIISVNFMDYLFMSLGHKWSSCHTVDCTNVRNQADEEHHYHGMYSAGTISYALDNSTVEMYLVDKEYKGKHFELQERVKRCNFHIGNGKIVQGRVYPDGRDGSDSETDIAEQMRNIFQRVISECLEVPNYWTLKRGRSACHKAIVHGTGAMNYPDYFNYDDCNVSYLGQPEAEKNFKKITVGHAPICISCGEYHDDSNGIECPKCRKHYIAYCSHCGRGIAEDDCYIYCEDNDSYYCDEDCAERSDVVHCEDDDRYHCSYNCYRDEWSGDWYYGEPEVTTVDGAKYSSEENACFDGYVYVKYSEEWVREDNVITMSDGTLFCNESDAENEGYILQENGVWVKENTEVA